MPRLKKRQSDKPVLRWLFVATFADGSTIIQGQDDKCLTRNDGTGSTFTDVLAKESQLATFELRHINGKETVLVDLVGGAFMVNGTPLHIHDQNFNPQVHELRLVYNREKREEQDVKYTLQEDKSVKQDLIGEPRSFINRYFIGWQTSTANGKNVQHTIAVG